MEINNQYFSTKCLSFSDSEAEGVAVGTFEGYASVFDVIDSYGDVVVKGAFRKSISMRPKVKMLWQHNQYEPIGSIELLGEDDKGLRVRGSINLGTTKGKDVYALLKAGHIDQMSIGYFTDKSDFDKTKNIRYLQEIDVREVSVVSFPANEDAKIIDVKSLESLESLSEIENYLRNNGFTRAGAKTLISKVKSLSPLRDAGSPIQREADLTNQAALDILGQWLNELKK
jgi:HK97 family phage prohead protease